MQAVLSPGWAGSCDHRETPGTLQILINHDASTAPRACKTAKNHRLISGRVNRVCSRPCQPGWQLGSCLQRQSWRCLQRQSGPEGFVGEVEGLRKRWVRHPPRSDAVVKATKVQGCSFSCLNSCWTRFLFCQKKKYDKSWCLSRAVVLQLEDPASCSVERKRLNKRLSCFTGRTGI